LKGLHKNVYLNFRKSPRFLVISYETQAATQNTVFSYHPQVGLTSAFDYNLIVWDYAGKAIGQPIKQTDLSMKTNQNQDLHHGKYAQGAISPPVIYSVVC
jgi:hypothetical protein